MVPSSVRDSSQSSVLDTLFTIIGVEDSLDIVDRQNYGQSRDDQPWVLSIDDDPCIAMALELRLQQEGVNLVRAACGLDGFRVATFQPPQVILLDYELPEENGDMVLRKLKAKRETASIPVVCLTGHSDRQIEYKMRALGAEAFITKPYNWQHLWRVIHSFISIGA